MRSVLAGLRTLVLPWGAGPTAARITLGSDVPAALQTFWQNGTGANQMVGAQLPLNYSMTVVGALLFFQNGGSNYSYLALVDGGAYAYVVFGSSFGQVHASYAITRPVGAPTQILNGSNISADHLDIVNSLNVPTGASWTIDNVSAARGLVAWSASASATVASVSNTTDVDVLVIANVTFKARRAYKVAVRGFQTSTAAQDVRHRVRTVSTAGQIIADYGDHAIINTASGGEGFYDEEIVINNTNADITHDVHWCFSLMTGTTTANVVSRNSCPAYLKIEDIGTYTDYTNAKVVV